MDHSPNTAAEPLKPSPAAPLPGVPEPPSAPPAVLPGFAVQDSWSAIQDSLYVILHHGPYQRRVLTCGVLSSFGVLLYAMSYLLLGREVDHWCSPPDYLAALSAAQWKNRSIPLQEDASFSKCTMYGPPFMEGKRNGSTVVSCDRWDYDIADRRDSIVSRFDLVCDRQYLYGLSFVAAILANAVLSPVAGFVSDRFGRKPVIIVCSFTWLIAAIGNSVAETYAMFITTRVLAYTACNSTFTLIFILLYEVTGNASRWLFTILDTAVAGTFGPPFVHVISGLEPRWELSQGVLLVPTVLTVIWCCLLSESPAWLLVTWDLQRAQAGALEAALVNGVSLPKAKATFLAIVNQMQKIAPSQMSTTGSPLAQERTFKLNTTRRKAAAAFFTRFTLNAIYFGMVATEEVSGMSWQLVDVFVTTAYYGAICLAVNKYGPKNAALIALGGVFMLAASKTLTVLFRSQDVQSILQAGTKIAVSVALSVVLFYTAEIFPTDRRSAGISMALLFGSSRTLCAIFVKTLSVGDDDSGAEIWCGESYGDLLRVRDVTGTECESLYLFVFVNDCGRIPSPIARASSTRVEAPG
ncbi:solute carrier family 22 member 7-like [Haemaphysalis longicornis]